MDNNELVILIRKYLDGEATQQESAVVEQYYALFDVVDQPFPFSESQWQDILMEMRQAIEEKIKGKPVRVLSRRRWWRMAAAAIVVFAGLGALFYMRKNTTSTSPAAEKPIGAAVITPGGNRASLTLADGSVITLDSARNGRLADQGAATILKVADGQLAYDAVEQPQTVQYNTLTTPKGGQYAVTLPDGSKVWLNALSSIRFPTAFAGKQRLVEISGEVYIEVAKDATKPFIVQADAVKVEALGTQFNVNAYADEKDITATLIEGVIRVSSGPSIHTIQPGEQVLTNRATREARTLSTVATDEVVAWKNGLTMFKSMDVQSIMRQLSRWYDVDVQYTGTIGPQKFTGTISRNADLKEVLNMLEYAGVHFTIKDRTIVVSP